MEWCSGRGAFARWCKSSPADRLADRLLLDGKLRPSLPVAISGLYYIRDQSIRRRETGRGLGPPLAPEIERPRPMPAPDPNGVTLGAGWPDSLSVEFETWACGNRRTRKRRAVAIFGNLRHGGWCCRWCAEPVPLFRRADAVYCSAGCRKRHKRARSNRAERLQSR